MVRFEWLIFGTFTFPPPGRKGVVRVAVRRRRVQTGRGRGVAPVRVRERADHPGRDRGGRRLQRNVHRQRLRDLRRAVPSLGEWQP